MLFSKQQELKWNACDLHCSKVIFSTDNAVYTTAGDHVLERKDGLQLTQSQEHVYEFENSVDKSSECVYAQVSPYDEIVSGH